MSAAQTRDTPQLDSQSTLIGECPVFDSPDGDDYEDAPDKPGAYQDWWLEVDPADPTRFLFRGTRTSGSQQDGDLPTTKTCLVEEPQAHPGPVRKMPKWMERVPILPHYDADRIGSMPEASWRVHEILGEAGVGLLYGPPQQGKSALVLDMAISIALDVPWANRPLKCGNVLYGV